MVVLRLIFEEKMKKDKYYAIFYKGKVMAYGTASRWQVKDWEKAGYTVLRAI